MQNIKIMNSLSSCLKCSRCKDKILKGKPAMYISGVDGGWGSWVKFCKPCSLDIGDAAKQMRTSLNY